MSSVWKTVIWERVNKFGKWVPYTGEVCQLLEQSFNKNLNSICLGDVDVKLKSYVVNLKELVQISESSGTKLQVRRLMCNEDNIPANQVMWEWRGDSRGLWHYYCTEVANVIENAYKAEKKHIDLSHFVPDYEYEINFESMVQKNKKTKYHRPIRRVSTTPYPRLKIQAGAAEDNVAESSYGQNQAIIPSHSVINEMKVKSRKKNIFVKQVSHLWNLITKSSDSDSECGSDNSNGSLTKKQCLSSDAANNIPGLMSTDRDEANLGAEYAIVDGKPWKLHWPPHTPQSKIRPVPGIEPLQEQSSKKRSNARRKETRRGSITSVTREINVLDEFTEELLQPPTNENSEEQMCIICYEALTAASAYDEDTTLAKLQLCSHIFHKSCLKAMYDSGPKDNHIQCPMCKTIHGVKHGIQPLGTMVYHVLPYSLPGYSECDTIRIIYDIPSGIQGPEHPNPGKHYSSRGFPRHCYMPDNEMGRKVLRLLVKAWERRLIFTIGSSSTTGEQNTVTWNEIHHKTEFGHNRYGHGFPDPNYFENVISELAAQGVTESTYAWFPA